MKKRTIVSLCACMLALFLVMGFIRYRQSITKPMYEEASDDEASIPNDNNATIRFSPHGLRDAIEFDDFYRVYQVQDAWYVYYYELYGPDGEIIGENGTRTPPIQYRTDTMIEITLYAGPHTRQHQYYETATGQLSDFYSDVILINGHILVQYMLDEGMRFLVIRDMFSEAVYHQYQLEHFASMANTMDGHVDIVWENNIISLTYLSGDDYSERTDCFQVEL